MSRLSALAIVAVAVAGCARASADGAAAGAAGEPAPAPVPDAPTAVAPAPHQSQFVIRQGDAVVTRERYERTRERYAGEMIVPGRTRLTYAAALNADATVASLEMKVFAADTASTPTQVGTVQVRGDSILVAVEAGPVASDGGFVAQRGTIPIINPSIATFEQIVRRARVLGGGRREVPIYVAGQEGDPTTAAVAFLGPDSATVAVGGVEMRFAIDAEGHVLGGAVPSQSLTIEQTTGGR
jgi:hypothetical protein